MAAPLTPLCAGYLLLLLAVFNAQPSDAGPRDEGERFRDVPSMLTTTCELDKAVIKRALDRELDFRLVMMVTERFADANNCYLPDTLGKGFLCLFPNSPRLHNRTAIPDAELMNVTKTLWCPSVFMEKLKERVSALGHRVCGYLKGLVRSCSDIQSERRAVGFLGRTFPHACVAYLKRECPAEEPEDIVVLPVIEAREAMVRAPPETAEDFERLARSEVGRQIPTRSIREMARTMTREQRDSIVQIFARQSREEKRESLEDALSDERIRKIKMQKELPDPATASMVDAVRPVSGMSQDTARALVEDPFTVRCLSSRELKELPLAAKCIPETNGTDPLELHPKDKRALLCDVCRSELGDDLPASCTKERSPRELAGDLRDLESLSTDQVREKARKFTKVQDEMNERQREQVAGGLKGKVQAMSEFTTEDIKDFSVYFTEEDVSEVRAKLQTDEVKGAYCEEMGKWRCGTEEKRRDKTRFCMTETNRSLSSLGTLSGGLDIERIANLSVEDIDGVQEDFAKNNARKGDRLAFIAKKKEALGGLANFDELDYAGIGSLVCDFEDADISIMAASAAAANEITSILQSIEEQKERIKDMEADESERDDINSCIQRVMPRMVDKVMEVLGAETPGENRKRRNTNTVGCDVINSMQAYSLSVEQLGRLDPDVFDSCAESLSDALTLAQVEATLAKAKDVKGAPATWNEVLSVALGVVLLGLDVSGIGSLNFTGSMATELIGSIGAATEAPFTFDQYENVWDAWSSQNSITAGNLTGSDLSTIQRVVCGIPPTDISDMNADALVEQLSVVGSLPCLSLAQVSALVAVYQSVESSSPNSTAVIAELGILIAGYDSSYFMSLDPDMVPSLAVHAVPLLKLQDFSTAQMNMLTREQALVASTSELSASQQACIQNRTESRDCNEDSVGGDSSSGGKDTTTVSSGGGGNSGSVGSSGRGDNSSGGSDSTTVSSEGGSNSGSGGSSSGGGGNSGSGGSTGGGDSTSGGKDSTTVSSGGSGSSGSGGSSTGGGGGSSGGGDSSSNTTTSAPSGGGGGSGSSGNSTDTDNSNGGVISDKNALLLSVDPAKISLENIEKVVADLRDKNVEVISLIPASVWANRDLGILLLRHSDEMSPVTRMAVIRNICAHMNADYITMEMKNSFPDLLSCLPLTDSAVTDLVSGENFNVDRLPPKARKQVKSLAESEFSDALASSSGGADALKNATRKMGKVMHKAKNSLVTSVVDKLIADGNVDVLKDVKLNDEQARYVGKKLAKGLATDLVPAEVGGKVTKAAAMAAFSKIPASVVAFVNSSLVKNLDDDASMEIISDAIEDLFKSDDSSMQATPAHRFDEPEKSPLMFQIMKNLRKSVASPLRTADADVLSPMLKAKLLNPPDLDDIGSAICEADLDEAFEQVNFTDKAMAYKIYARCKATWTSDHALRQMAEGFTVADIKDLKASVKTSEHVGRFCDKATYMDESQLRELAKLVEARIPLDNGDVEKLGNYSCVMPYVSEALRNNVTVSRGDLCANLSSRVDTTQLSADTTNDMIDYCFNQNFSSTSLRAMAKVRSDGVPPLVCGIHISSYNDHIDCDKVDAASDLLGSCIGNSEVATAMYNCKNHDLSNEVTASVMWWFIDVMNATERTRLSVAHLCGKLEEYSAVKQAQGKWLKRRARLGFNANDALYDAYDRYSPDNAGVKAALNLLRDVEKSSTCSSTSKRRRRATQTLTCEDVEREGNLLGTRASTEMDLMTTTEFKECAADIGRLDLPDGHREAFASKAVSAYGDVESWDADIVLSLGGTVSGLNTANLTKLPSHAVDFDAMTRIGRYGNWDAPEKSTILADHYIKNALGGAAEMTATDLLAMGQIAGGINSDHIAAFPKDAYCGGASDIGALANMEEIQQVAWAIHAKACFGEVATWSSAEVKSVGNVVGGLEGTDLQQLTEAHITEISPTSIRLIPAKSFAKFSVAQIGFLNSAQAMALTEEQMNSLSPEQRAALDKHFGSVDAGNGESGAGFVEASLFLVVTTVSAVFCRI